MGWHDVKGPGNATYQSHTTKEREINDSIALFSEAVELPFSSDTEFTSERAKNMDCEELANERKYDYVVRKKS